MQSRCTLPLLVVVIASLLSWTAHTQDTQRLHPDMPGEWKVSRDNTYLARYALAPTEVADYRRRLDTLASMFHATAVFSPPKGFEARVHMRPWTDSDDCTPLPCRTQPVKTQFALLFCPLFDIAGKMDVASNGPPYLTVWVNAVDQTIAAPHVPIDGNLHDLEGAAIYSEPVKTGELWGFPVFDYRTLIVTNSRTAYWLPVSREQYLRARIRAWESDLKESAAFASGALQAMEEQVASLRGELTSMSATERRTQAWYSSLRFDGTGPVSGLTEAGASGARPLIRVNLYFFDRTQSRAAFQMAVVQFAWEVGGNESQIRSARIEDYANNGVFALAIARMYELMHTMDWRKLAALLSAAPVPSP